MKYKKNEFLLFIIIFFLLYNFYFFKNYDFCMKCIENDKKSLKCLKCPIEIIFKGLKVFSNEETVDEIIKNKKSISRFGDGEFQLIFGKNIGFQKNNKIIRDKLIKILKNNEKNLLVGIIQYKTLNKLLNYENEFWSNFLDKYKFQLVKVLNKKKKYYSSTISRFYLRYKDKSKMYKYIKKLKKIWENRDILIIEGEKSRNGLGNNLFDNSKSIKRIICPNTNAFKVYNKIILQVLKNDKNILILISLGPTATILSYDLNKLGYQSIDIGHLDIEYEWYLRNATKKMKIENKIFNEIGGKNKFTKIKDKKYFKQIIAKITK